MFNYFIIEPVTAMHSASLLKWRTDRTFRLVEVENHCAAVGSMIPPNPNFLEECLRGLVLHLSAHFQGFSRDLYTECSQICVAAIPAGLQATAQAQFAAQLALEKGNPSLENLKKDFNRFGFLLQLQGSGLTDLKHLNDWRNKAAHQKRRSSRLVAVPRSTMADVVRWTRSGSRRYHVC